MSFSSTTDPYDFDLFLKSCQLVNSSEDETVLDSKTIVETFQNA